MVYKVQPGTEAKGSFADKVVSELNFEEPVMFFSGWTHDIPYKEQCVFIWIAGSSVPLKDWEIQEETWEMKQQRVGGARLSGGL